MASSAVFFFLDEIHWRWCFSFHLSLCSFVCIWKTAETPAIAIFVVIDVSIQVGLSGIVGLDHVCSLLYNQQNRILTLSQSLLLCWAKISIGGKKKKRKKKRQSKPNNPHLPQASFRRAVHLSAWMLNEARCCTFPSAQNHTSRCCRCVATKLISGPNFQRSRRELFSWAFVQVSPTCKSGESVCWRWCQKPVNTKIKILQLLISCAHEPDSLWAHGSY